MVSIDTETNWAKSESERYIIGFSVATNTGFSAYVPLEHGAYIAGDSTEGLNVEVPYDLLEAVRGKTVVFHNAKFDMNQLRKKMDISPLYGSNVYCTMVMGNIIDENQFVSLDSMGKKYCGAEKLTDLAKAMKGTHWHNIPPYIMGRYAEQDTKLTLSLYLALQPYFTEYEEYWKTERQFMFLLQRMEVKGIPVDLAFCREQSAKCSSRQLEIERELGFDPAKTSLLHKKLFGEVPDGLALKATSFTPGGKPQANEAFLESVNHPIAGLILEHRKLGKAASTYFNAYLRHADSEGRVHATYKQHQTVTGRLSCADPNLQQIPRKGNVKASFNAEKGYQLWEFDYANIEYRLAAVYSKDQDTIRRFEAGEDFHQNMADRVGITRQHAKTLNFLTIFGGGEGAVVSQLRISLKEARNLLKEYWEKNPALRDIIAQVNDTGERNLKIRLWSGRYRHFTYRSEARKAFNSLIQGGAFEIVKRSMLRLEEAGYDIRSTVHDSVWVMLPTPVTSDHVEAVKHIMSDWTHEAFGLTFAVDAKRLK